MIAIDIQIILDTWSLKNCIASLSITTHLKVKMKNIYPI